MKNEIVEYYIERSNIISILKHCKVFRRINILLVVSLLIVLCISSVNYWILRNNIISILGWIMYFGVIILYIILLTRCSKREIADYHATTELGIINILKEKKVYNVESIVLINEMKAGLISEAKNSKFEFPVFSSTMALLLLALFNSFLSYILKYDYIKDINEGMKFYTITFLVIVLTFVLIYFIKASFSSMAEDIMNSRSNKVKRLCNKLDDIIFDLKIASKYNN